MHPPETTLYFVRHGESVANAGGITMEHASIPLTPHGRAQALAVAAALPNHPSKVLVSPYLRARETAEPYSARVGCAIDVNPLMQEFSAIDPALLKGMTGVQRRPIADAYWAAADPSVRMGAAAETFSEFNGRVGEFVGSLTELPGLSVLFGHGIWFGLVCWHLDGHGVEDSRDMKAFRAFQRAMSMPNGAVYVLKACTEGRWRYAIDGDTARKISAMPNHISKSGPSISSSFS
jgi:broad specificity phosphatase PhoE